MESQFPKRRKKFVGLPEPVAGERADARRARVKPGRLMR